MVQYISVKKAPPTGQRATGARVLTSEECAQMIFERDEKKKQQQEKEARKVERELKKKEREEAAKRKAEQVAKKKEEAARKKIEAAKKKEEIARKKEEICRKKLEKATGSITRQVTRRMNDTRGSVAKRRRV